MIPTEEAILDDLIAGRIAKEKALQMLHDLTDYKYRREALAAGAMQGLAVRAFPVDPGEAARMAVQHADALIAALDK